MITLNTRCFEITYSKGSVRWIKYNDIEIIRMIYSAVRDRNWGTIEPEIISENITEDELGFRIDIQARYRLNDIYFEAVYYVAGTGNLLVFEMEGEAKSTFLSNRTGFCVLHPIKECAGKAGLVLHPDGTTETAAFPETISPHQPMKNISALEWYPAEDIKARLQFPGDVFEMEDQRNWTDASYKTYCRPLHLPFPYEIKEGDKIMQKVELEIFPETLTHTKHQEGINFNIEQGKSYLLPKIGVANTSRREPITKKEAAVLRSYSFDHLRYELKLFEKNWMPEWAKAVGEAMRLNIPLFTVIYFSENAAAEMADLKKAVLRTVVQVKYIMVVGRNHLPDDNLFNMVFDELKTLFPQALIGSGVNAHFAELNRNRPLAEKAEFMSFAVCPQVHAFDNASMVENMEGQKYAVESARNIFPDKPVFVSPVTLKQRFNVVATTEGLASLPDDLPPQVDVRQAYVFAAQWLLGSLKFLAQSGTSVVTYFETVGWRGFTQGDFDPPVSEKFPVQKGDIFPAFQLLKELKGYNEAVHSDSTSPLQVDGLALRNSQSGAGKIILVNFDSILHKIKLAGIKVPDNYLQMGNKSAFHTEGEYVSVPAEGIIIFHCNF